MKEFCGLFEFQFFFFRHSELDDVRFVVRRVVAVESMPLLINTLTLKLLVVK
jgi:hypothetical protein